MHTKDDNRVYPRKSNPYYIITPPYTRTSAGIKALHLLCHHLNLNGYPAYLIITDRGYTVNNELLTHPDFLTPRLTQSIANYHFIDGRRPIVIYPEIIRGNPLKADCVARYILNFPGLLGGNTTYPETEFIFSYSKALAQHTNFPDNILFIPASNTDIYHPATEKITRSGSCFYAAKYQEVHRGELFQITKNSIEITRDESRFTPEVIANLFQECEVFYTYENTALAIEAALCGCPTVFLPNRHLDKIIASDELGQDGYAWGTDPEEIQRARETVALAFENYTKAVANFKQDLKKFINQTQVLSKTKSYSLAQHTQLINILTKDINFISDPDNKNNDEPAKYLLFFPWWVERFVGEALSSLGLLNDGDYLWNRATDRYNRIKLGKQEFAPVFERLPWRAEMYAGKLFILAGLKHDGELLILRAVQRSKHKPL
jgi:hypothetical protein